MNEFQFLLDSDENIIDVEQNLTNENEKCFNIVVGDDKNQFELCLTKSELQTLLNMCD